MKLYKNKLPLKGDGYRAMGVDKMRGAGFWDPILGNTHGWVHKEAMKDRDKKAGREHCKAIGSEEREDTKKVVVANDYSLPKKHHR